MTEVPARVRPRLRALRSEHAVLGYGAAGALGLTWGVTRYVFDMTWRPVPGLLASGALLTALLVGAIGVLATLMCCGKKPLTIRA